MRVREVVGSAGSLHVQARRRLLEPVGLSLTAGAVGQAVLLVTSTLAARLLGPQERGELALLLLLPPTLTQFGTLGYPLALTYHIAGNTASPSAMVRRALTPAAWQALGIVLVNAVIVALIAALGREGLVLPALIGLASIPGWVALQYGLAILQGCRAFGPFNLGRQIPSVVYLVLLIGCYLLPGGRLPAVMAAWVIGHTLAGIVVAVLAARRCRSAESPGRETPSHARMMRFGLRSLFGSVSPIETLRADQAIVGLVLGAASLGLYVVALAFTSLPRFIAQSFGYVAYPSVAAARAATGSGRRVGMRLFGFSLAFILPVTVLLALLAGPLTHTFFGAEFAGAVTPARILLAGTACIAVRRVLAECARGAGRGGLDSIAELVLWTLFLPAVVLVGDEHGLTGIAIALASASAVSFATLVVLLWVGTGRLLPSPEPADAPAKAKAVKGVRP